MEAVVPNAHGSGHATTTAVAAILKDQKNWTDDQVHVEKTD